MSAPGHYLWEILPLRLENSTGSAILVDGVGADHRATDVLA